MTTNLKKAARISNPQGRPKKYSTPYCGDCKQLNTVFEEYLSCVADCFGEPYDDRRERSQNAPSLRDVCNEFGISIPKARKLLITAEMYSTEQSRHVSELAAQGKSVVEIMVLTGIRRSSVSSYLPYQKYAYCMAEMSRHAADSRKYRERQKAVEDLHDKIRVGENAENALWQALIAYQGYPFHTSSGLPFTYSVRQKKNGEYSGEIIVSRKEESKTLTRSSVLLAYHTVLGKTVTVNVIDTEGKKVPFLMPPEYNGPKSIGQIFGISYIYSIFWKLGLVKVPEKVEKKLKGKR